MRGLCRRARGGRVGLETLTLYKREKAGDGTLYADFSLPAFDALDLDLDLDGWPVSSSSLLGKPTLLALFAIHCGHSMQSMAFLQKLHDDYAARGVNVAAVFINSGPADELRELIPVMTDHQAFSFPIWSQDSEALGTQLQTQLVPTYLFVTAGGNVTKKLVGFKELDVLTQELAQRLR